MASSYSRLIADIGNTFARFAVVNDADHKPERVTSVQCAGYPDFYAAIRAYLDTLGPARIHHAAVAIANPVEGDTVRMVNLHWQFSIEETRRRLGLETLLVVNDFTALAMALPHLGPDQIHQVGGGAADQHSAIALLGPGTGLGVSGLIPVESGWVSLGTEGGHAAFSAQDDTEIYLLQYARRKFGHVSSERFISGPGIEMTYQALCERAHVPTERIDARDIVRRALKQDCAICGQVLDAFCAMLGTVAGDLALTLGAKGGVYLDGNIVRQVADYLPRSPFRQRFESKGRFSTYLAGIPTFIIKTEAATFLGVSTVLDHQLRKQALHGSIVDDIRRLRNDLTKAERLVADYALSSPQALLDSPISEIAKNIQVSDPTIIRFCRAIGCKGLSDFKLKLASGLRAAIAVTHTQINYDDDAPEFGANVFSNTVSAIQEVHNRLDRQAIDRAVSLLAGARRIEFFGLGNHGIVAHDAQYKFLRLGIPTNVYSESRMITLAAAAVTKQDVIVVFSEKGQVPDLVNAVKNAVANGAAVIAITAGRSALSNLATLTIPVDPLEDPTTPMPMISRILQLLVLDVIVLGMAHIRDKPGAVAVGRSAGRRGIQ